jgi:hypothetical protein
MKFLKNTIAILVFSCLTIGTAFSQTIDSAKVKPSADQIRYPNIIKLNSLALAFNNISLIYERGIIPRVSAGIGVGYKYKGTLPSLLNIENSEIIVDFGDITGFSITPEAKYYLRACDPGKLEGFYVGLYFRYTGYQSGADFEYIPESSPTEYYYSDIHMNEFGVGIQLGYQMIIKERFSIDFLLIGPRFSSYKLGYEFDKPPSEQFLNDLSDALNEVVDRFGFDYNVDINQEGEAKANSSFSFANVRFGLSLGFAF